MNKVFLYLYPMEEYNRIFLFPDEFYEEMRREKPFRVLNECIQKRYREKGYQVVYAMYPNKEIYGIKPMPVDKVIYTDIPFKEASGINEDGSKKSKDEIKYPNESYLINQLKDINEIVIGGFHFNSCVKRVAEYCYDNGIDTLVDLDLTDLFFHLYHKNSYFRKDEYDPDRYKKYLYDKQILEFEKDNFEENFKNRYGSPVYGFYEKENKKTR